MEHKEKEVVIDIENGDANASNDPPSDSNWGDRTLNKLVSGILSFNGSSDDESGVESDGVSGGSADEPPPNETTKLLGDKAPDRQQGPGRGPLVGKENERERRKGGRAKKASKPPRPPKGPTLDAADMRLLKEISRIAIKKRERMERLKALKKMKSPRLASSLSTSQSSSSSSSSVCSSTATISAMFVTIFFFLVLILQGLSSSNGSNLTIAGAPQPAPETRGLSPVQFYKTVMSDDGVAPSFLPPKSA